jgi:hypothetical protein
LAKKVRLAIKEIYWEGTNGAIHADLCHVWSNDRVRVTARNVSFSTVDLPAAALHVQLVNWRRAMHAPGEDAAISRDSLPLASLEFRMVERV